MVNFYAVLGVERTFTRGEIRKAYRKMVKRWHPDKNPNNLEEANKKFQEILKAYGVLSDGYALGSIERRVAIQYVNPVNQKDDFIFKCHRSGNAPNFQDIYAVNHIAFHPVHGIIVTVGSDGTFSFWDKDACNKLKSSKILDQPITKCGFNANGQIFAYAVGYDWSKGHEFYNPAKKPCSR